MKELTDRQRQILEFIQRKQESEKLTPTLREIASHFHFNSVNAALAHVQALCAKGFLKSFPGRARSLQVVDRLKPNFGARTKMSARRLALAHETPALSDHAQIVSVPIYGSIPAGRPVETTQEEEGCILIDVDTLGIKPTTRTFGLKVQGDSMIGKS